MLTITGQKYRFCDGLSRRGFLSVGGLTLGGLTLPQILRAESQQGIRNGHKAIINIFLPGGPPHQDMWDLKPNAPKEVRGEFDEISTNVPGIRIGDQFPRMARMMDKFTIIRSMVGANGRHDAWQCQTGRGNFGNQPPGGWPSMGAVLSKLHGPAAKGVPPFVGLVPDTGHKPWGDPGASGFLGPAHSPFLPAKAGGVKEDMKLNGINLDRLDRRRSLLTQFDQLRRDVDNKRQMEGLDAFNEQALSMLTSARFAEALDIKKEDVKLRDRYGRGHNKKQADGSHKLLDDFLLARRLVEAGARCVTLAFSRWDWHGGNFKRGREDMPMLDQALTALVEDLHSRGMDRDVSVVVWGEFGRTPTINNKAGRDHWPRVSCAALACGGMNHGQVIGATDKKAGEAVDRPVKFGEVFATLYTAMGINIQATTVPDLQGRPRYLVDDGVKPLQELIS
ncbi:MAG: DUF1501 domain-containing protein [Verrucomicrobiota bacterium]|jgi:hypothetical protein|nr:DUF1501 domain-containing protein [Verrucomicrobiota bacterium]